MKKIEEFLQKKENGTKLLYDTARIKEKVEPLLAKIVETFPEYTSHDISHSERILEIYGFLIPDSLFKQMNSYELYFLIASTYLHDIGMVRSEFEKIVNEEKIKIDDSKKLQDLIREKHHETTEKVCIKEHEKFCIDDPHQATIIGRICRGHRKENLHDSTLFKNDRMYKNNQINVPLLASLLRNGDELDITFERTPYVVYENSPPKDKISKEEWEKHLSISGVGKDKQDEQIIKCSAICKNPKIHRLLKALEIKVNEGLEDLPSHLQQYHEDRKDIPRKFIINIEAVGYEPYDFKFSLQEIEIMNLLMGDKLYERREECIRELLKNTVDACRLREFRSIKDDGYYTPIIKFELNSDELIVTDNGIGMNKYIIENYFTKIGKSFYRSQEFLKEESEFSPVSELGIGVLSYFMIADRIYVDTKTEKEDAIYLEINDFSDYFFVKKGSREKAGTKITLSLKKEINKLHLEEEIKLFASHLEFPIKVFFQGREISVINEEFLSKEMLIKTGVLQRIYLAIQNRHLYGINHIILSKSKTILEKLLNDSQLKVHELDIKEEFIEGKVGFLMANESYFENLFSHMYLQSIFMPRLSTHNDGLISLSLDPLEGIAHISNAGIHVCFEKLSIPWFNSVVLADLNLKKNILDLNVARNKCVVNEKKNKLNDYIEEQLLKCVMNFLDTMRHDSNFSRKAYAFMNTFIKFQSTENQIYKLLNEYYYLKQISKNGVSYIRYDESIFKTDKKIMLLTEVPLDSDLENILPHITGFKEDYLYFAYTKNLYNLIPNSIWGLKKIETVSFCEFLIINRRQHMNLLVYYAIDDEISIDNNESGTSMTDNETVDIFMAEFQNYTSPKYIGFYNIPDICSNGIAFYLNSKHRFIKFIDKYSQETPDDPLLGAFMQKILDIRYFSYNIDLIISSQRRFLLSCLERDLISKREFDNLLLSKEDFVMYPHGFNF